jgi:peptidyl-tRNA hydrolase, PTH2 family
LRPFFAYYAPVSSQNRERNSTKIHFAHFFFSSWSFRTVSEEMDALDDPYTVFFTTAEEGGTVVGLIACMVVWCFLGAAAGYAYRQQTNVSPVEESRPTDESFVNQSESLAVPGRKARARAAEEAARSAKNKKVEIPVCENDADEEDWSDEGEETSDDDGDDDGYDSEELEEMRLKMVLIVRKDEPLLSAPSIASEAAQAALDVLHQTYQAYHRAASDDAKATTEEAERWWRWYLWWSRIGVAKITLKCPDRQTLMDLHAKAVEYSLPCALVEGDVLAVGPAPSRDLDVISGTLKLLN